MSGKIINFGDISTKSTKAIFTKVKKLFKIEDIDINKILVSKKESYRKKILLNTSLDIMMTMSLDHYVQSYVK